MKYWTINVIKSKGGYSFAVQSELCTRESEVINACLELDYFDEPSDADVAVVEEITNDAYELEYWKNEVLSLD